MTREGSGSAAESHATAPGSAPAPVVVVVEDDIGTLGLLADVAEDAGWEARTCRSLGQFARTLDDVDPSLVILDDDLPDGLGGDEAILMRTDPGTSDVPVVVCTGASHRRLAELGGRVPIVTKPFTIRDIEYLLDAALQRRRRLTNRASG